LFSSLKVFLAHLYVYKTLQRYTNMLIQPKLFAEINLSAVSGLPFAKTIENYQWSVFGRSFAFVAASLMMAAMSDTLTIQSMG